MAEFTENDFQTLIDIILDCENEIANDTGWISEGVHKAYAYDQIIQEIDAVWDSLPAKVQDRYKL